MDFKRGHSAIVELAGLIGRVSEFTDLSRGITVNAGVIGGRTRSNVVASEAWADVDVRIAWRADSVRIERFFHALRPIDTKCILSIEGGLNRPPMERTAKTVRLFRMARKLAARMGIALEETATGGGSDGNFTSALGVPTLDGMGAVGEGAHAAHESIVLEQLAPRTALLAAMIGSANLGCQAWDARGTIMLRALEFALLGVSILVFLGLIVTAPARRRSRTEAEAGRIAEDATRCGDSEKRP